MHSEDKYCTLDVWDESDMLTFVIADKAAEKGLLDGPSFPKFHDEMRNTLSSFGSAAIRDGFKSKLDACDDDVTFNELATWLAHAKTKLAIPRDAGFAISNMLEVSQIRSIFMSSLGKGGAATREILQIRKELFAKRFKFVPAHILLGLMILTLGTAAIYLATGG